MVTSSEFGPRTEGWVLEGEEYSLPKSVPTIIDKIFGQHNKTALVAVLEEKKCVAQSPAKVRGHHHGWHIWSEDSTGMRWL